jgi:hypothetical protein
MHDTTPFLVPILTYYAPGVIVLQMVIPCSRLEVAAVYVFISFVRCIFPNLFPSVPMEVLPEEMDVSQDRRVDIPEELDAEVEIAAGVGQRVVVVAEEAESVEEGLIFLYEQ